MLELLIRIGDYFPYCFTIVDMDINKDRPCIYANKKFQDDTGFKPDEAIGRNLSYLQGELTAKDTTEFMRKCFNEGQACIQDIVNYKKNGTPFLNRLLLIPMKSADQYFYIGFQNDITDSRGLGYDNLSLKNVNSQEIRHIVNNPLTIILLKFSLKFKTYTKIEEIESLAKELSTFFTRINHYALNIEKVSQFDRFNPNSLDSIL
jgi:PAS domain S-box-containing protein